jgi:two-component system NtrC family response regulator
MAATKFDLWELVRNGKIREDLYFGLMQLQLRVPPLSAREGDALMLSSHFLEKHARLNNRPAHDFSDRALTMISEYSWPGNVRELEGRIKRAAIMADTAIISEKDLDFGPLVGSYQRRTLRDVRADAERKAIKETLAITNGNISRAARMLNISRPTLYSLMNQLGIRNPQRASTSKQIANSENQS